MPMPCGTEASSRTLKRLEAEIAKSEDGRARLTTACLRSLPRDEGGPGAGVVEPAAVPVPPRQDGIQDEPMNAEEALRKRSAEDAGHEADVAGCGGAQPDPGSMVDDSMPELRRKAEALGADAVALAEAYSSATRQRVICKSRTSMVICLAAKRSKESDTDAQLHKERVITVRKASKSASQVPQERCPK